MNAMKAHLLWVALVVMIVIVPSPAWAQRRMPHADANAVGAEVGVFMPKQDGMSTGPDIQGTFEHYVSARNSVRLDVGWMQPKRGNDSNVKMRQIRVAGDLVHNWEGGAIHPFVGAGLGVYFLQQRINGANAGDGTTKVGGTLFGGAEFFTSKTVAVKAEARYHIVSDWNGYDPSGFSLTIGLKSYF